MQPKKIWVNYLLVVVAIGTILGVELAFTPFITNIGGALYYNHYVGADAYASLGAGELANQRFLYGVMGAVMASWMIALSFLVHIPFRRGEVWAWNAIAVSTLMWFIGDGYASIITGFALHAALNLSLLVLIGAGLVATWKDFHPQLVRA